jgi:hypothetical protein
MPAIQCIVSLHLQSHWTTHLSGMFNWPPDLGKESICMAKNAAMNEAGS